jgi:hypothetical protein
VQIRASLERHFGVKFAFQNHCVVAFREAATGTPTHQQFTSIVLPPSPRHRGVPDLQMLAQQPAGQCVTPYFRGGGRNVAATICRWSTCCGRPDRASSANPARPRAAYPARQRRTIGRDTPTSSAIRALAIPSAARSTIRARCANPAHTDDDRGSRSSCSRSQARNTHHSHRRSTNDAEH